MVLPPRALLHCAPLSTLSNQTSTGTPGNREQVVQFILQNTAADSGPPGQFVDPYTGAGAYVPPPPSAGPSGADPSGGGSFVGGSADPFTGTGAYVPSSSVGGGSGGSAAGGYGVTGGGADPFTGGGAALPRHLPARNYLIFDQVGWPW